MRCLLILLHCYSLSLISIILTEINKFYSISSQSMFLHCHFNYWISLMTLSRKFTQAQAILLMIHSVNKSQFFLWFLTIIKTIHWKSYWMTQIILSRLTYIWVRNIIFKLTDQKKLLSQCWIIKKMMYNERHWISRNILSYFFLKWLYRYWYLSKIDIKCIK